VVRHDRLGETLLPCVWALTLVYFGQNVPGYGLVVFLPRSSSLSNMQTGFVTALPWPVRFSAAALTSCLVFNEPLLISSLSSSR
jgi:hypothetical protein